MSERFAPIAEFDGKYLISDHGRVRRAKPFNRGDDPYEIKAFKLPNGYWQVGLRHNGKKHTRYVHRLVAEAFIPNPDNLPEVNHRFGDKDDNRWTELEWSTPSGNVSHRYHVLKKTRRKYVIETPDGEVIFTDNLSAFGREVGLDQRQLQSTAAGRQTHVRGYRVRYQKES